MSPPTDHPERLTVWEQFGVLVTSDAFINETQTLQKLVSCRERLAWLREQVETMRREAVEEESRPAVDEFERDWARGRITACDAVLHFLRRQHNVTAK